MILETSFNNLVAPPFLTTELSIMLVGLFIGTLYASLRLRSLFSLFGWAIMIISLIITFISNLQLLWFWLAVTAEAFILVLSMIEYTRRTRGAKT